MKSKSRKLKNSGIHKKNDDIDPEIGNNKLVEESMQEDNNKKINILASQVSAIKSISKGLGEHVNNEAGLLGDLDGKFGEAKQHMKGLMS